jgi:hypothetical protein
VGSVEPGSIQACVAVHTPGASTPASRLPLRVLSAAAASGPYRLLDGGTMLCVGRVPVVF